MSRSHQIGLRRVGSIAGIAGGGSPEPAPPKFTSDTGVLCPEIAGIAEMPGEFAYTPPIPRGAICNGMGGAASNGGVIVGPQLPYAFYEGVLCPETAGIAEIPGEFAYTPPLPRGAICNAVGGVSSKQGVIPGPGAPFALYGGMLCPEMAGIAEIPGEFAYTPPLPRGAICNAVGGGSSKQGAFRTSIGGIVSYQGCIINSIGGG